VIKEPLSGPAKDLYMKVVDGFKVSMEYSTVNPWDLSYMFIIDIRRIEMSSEDLKGDEVLDVLARASNVNYIELKEDWDKLSIEERKDVIHRIVGAMASLGLMSAFGSIAIYAEPYKKEEILRTASKYYERKISYDEMVSEIEDVLWPTRREKIRYWRFIENYRKAMSLAVYLPEAVVRAIIDVYLISMIRFQMFDNIYYLPSVYPNLLS
jgi:hypothetical protein